MKLRNHPALNYNGIRSWPPLWSPAKTPEDKKTLRGEIGILKSTYTVPKTRECYLVIEQLKAESDATTCAEPGKSPALR